MIMLSILLLIPFRLGTLELDSGQVYNLSRQAYRIVSRLLSGVSFLPSLSPKLPLSLPPFFSPSFLEVQGLFG